MEIQSRSPLCAPIVYLARRPAGQVGSGAKGSKASLGWRLKGEGTLAEYLRVGVGRGEGGQGKGGLEM